MHKDWHIAAGVAEEFAGMLLVEGILSKQKGSDATGHGFCCWSQVPGLLNVHDMAVPCVPVLHMDDVLNSTVPATHVVTNVAALDLIT